MVIKLFFHVEGGDNAGLYRMNVDGTQLEYVAVGEISGIHCTSRYTFFSYYEDQSTHLQNTYNCTNNNY